MGNATRSMSSTSLPKTLRVSPAEANATESSGWMEAASDSEDSTHIRLLIVDDHSVVRHGATSWLKAHKGCHVVGEAETASQAVALAIQHKPDIVLMDIGLGDEGGLCAAYKIARTCPTTSVIAYTASSDPVHVRGMLAAGAKGYVLKTSDPPVLLLAISAVLEGLRFLDPGLSETVIDELALLPGTSRSTRELLTPREWDVLECIVWGYRNREIAAELRIKITSVNTYRIRICEKLGLKNKAEIIRFGVVAGLTATRISPQRPPNAAVGQDDLGAPASGLVKKAC